MDSGASFTGGANADTFTAATTSLGVQTLSAGDNLNGGGGLTDTLNITNTVAALTLGSGVTTTNIENVSITATAATTVDATGFAGVTNVTNSGSTVAVTVTGLKAIPSVSVTGTSTDTTVTMDAAAVAGATDALTLNVNGAATTAAQNNTVVVNGIETVNVATSGSTTGSATGALVVSSNVLNTLNVTGTTAATLSANLPGANATTTGTVTSDAGAHNVVIGGVAATSKLSVNMGPGNDGVQISTIAAIHTIAGGDGTDTLEALTAITAVTGANISSFEAVKVGALSVALPAGNNIAAVTFTGTGGSVTGLAAGGVITQEVAGTNAVVNTAWTGTADAVTVNFGTATSTTLGAQSLTALLALETVTINNLQLGSDITGRTVGATGAAISTINVTSAGLAPITIAGGGVALTNVNAAGVNGAVTVTAIVNTAGAQLIGGTGNDTLGGGAGVDTLTGGNGNDSLTGLAGNDVLSGGGGNDTLAGGVGVDNLTGGDGNDVFTFGVNATGLIESGASLTDTIMDFTSGSDRLLFAQANTSFVGNVANIQLGLAAMTGANQSFFVTTENNLYVVATQGTLGNLDTVIKLDKVTSLTAADVGTGTGSQPGGADLTLTAANTFTATALSTGGSVFTAADDTFRSTSLQFLEDTDVVGGNGIDTIAITAGAAASSLTAGEADGLLGFERMTLGENTVSGGASTTAAIEWDDVNIPSGTFTFTAAGLTTIASNFTGVAINGTNAGTGTLNLTGSDFTGAGDTLVGGSFNDTINGGAGNDTITGGVGNDSLLGGLGDDTIVAAGTDTIDGGSGNDVVQIAASIGTSATVLASIELGAGVNQVAYTATASTANASIAATGGVYGIQIANTVTATMTPAQFAGAYQVVGVNGGAAEGVTFSTNGTINATGVTDIVNLALSAGTTGTGANTLTVTTISTAITGAGGADTINVAGGAAANAVLAGTIIGNAGTDVVNVTGNTNTAATLANTTNTIETINFSNTDTTVALITDAANLTAVTQTLTVNATSLTTGTLNFNGAAETGATPGNYSVTGGAGADTIIGGGGNDTITAGTGANNLTGNAGNDSITGGALVDTVYADNSGTRTAYATADITVAAGGDSTGNSSAAITYMGITINTGNIIRAGAAATLIEVATGVRLAINTDPVMSKLLVATGTAGTVAIITTSLVDGTTATLPTVTVTAGANAATFTSGAATAGTAGVSGVDVISGGASADFIVGGGGADTITGGAGADNLFFLQAHSTLSSLNVITDYRAAAGDNAGALDTIIIGNVATAAGTNATVQDLSASASLGAALNAAANTNAQAAGLSVFMWGGNTYAFVETTGGTTTFVTSDFLVQIVGTPFTTATGIAGLGIDGV